jgi:hypothetical protein
MEYSRQQLFWTIVGSVAAVASVLIGLRQCSGGSTPSATSRSSSPAAGLATQTPTFSASAASTTPATFNAPSLTYLADMTPAGDMGQFVEQRLVQIHGSVYSKSVAFYCGNRDSPGVFSLNGTASRFTAMVGLEDKWPSDYLVSVSIVGDGHTLKTFSVSVLKPQKININVTGVYRLELDCSFAVDSSGTGGWNVEVAWGDARLAESR